jgi:hypothetical protein
MDVERMRYEARLVELGQLVKVDEHEWYWQDGGDADEKAVQMATSCGIDFCVVQIHEGRFAEWYTVKSNPGPMEHIVAQRVPTPDWPFDDPRWPAWEAEHCEGGGVRPR